MELAIYGFIPPKRKIEAAGISYEYLIIKDKLALGLSTFPVLQIPDKTEQLTTDADLEEPTEWMDPEDTKYAKYISRLDPNNVREQDHYKVLGLSKLRYQATQAQIKTAYRHKVLIYHPDKGKTHDIELRTESVFACIQKAYEQLGTSEEKRRAFDSVDPKFDETIPISADLEASEDFFKLFGPVFERNSRFSINQPVPMLGDLNSSRSHVEHFYEFWFDWRSWREFSYLDSEDKTKGEDRWERREIEKQNKAEREKRRKKDLKRISTLVELAYSKDPRIGIFKEADRRKKQEMKEQKRREREMKERAEQEEQKKLEEAMEEDRKKQEEEEKRIAQAKQQKKKVLAAQRKRLRDLASSSNYWLLEEEKQQTQKQKEMLTIMEQIERICLSAEFDELSTICEQLSAITCYGEALKILKNSCTSTQIAQKNEEKKGIMNGEKGGGRPQGIWSPAELQLMVKAVNLFPPGTQERWKQVAEYVSYHGGQQRTEKDVIKQVKLLKSDPASNSTSASQIKMAKNLEQISAKTTPNSTTPIPSTATTTANREATEECNGGGVDEWNAEQQKQLEKALKETKVADTERWEKIAAMVEGKSKKQCIRRYKKLAEMVKQSKMAGEGGGGNQQQ